MRLFKYCDGGGIGILRTCAIKVSSPLELNDPFDCKPVPDIESPGSKAALQEMICESSPVWRSLQAGVIEQGLPKGLDLESLGLAWNQILEEHTSDHTHVARAMEDCYSRLAILCLSAQSNHHLMWAHYADRHRGLVVEFETDGIFEVGGEETTITNRLFRVLYSDIRPRFTFDSTNPGAFTTKGVPWEYEEEWRVIYLTQQFEPQIIDGKEMRLRPIPAHAIKSIRLGASMEEGLKREVRTLLQVPKFRHVQLFQMELAPKEFSLNAIPVLQVN